jgi:hypothetical protein
VDCKEQKTASYMQPRKYEQITNEYTYKKLVDLNSDMQSECERNLARNNKELNQCVGDVPLRKLVK